MATAAYLHHVLLEGAEMHACYNIILAGQYGVGKTSIFRRLRNADGIEESIDERGLDRFTYQTRRKEREIEVSGVPQIR